MYLIILSQNIVGGKGWQTPCNILKQKINLLESYKNDDITKQTLCGNLEKILLISTIFILLLVYFGELTLMLNHGWTIQVIALVSGLITDHDPKQNDCVRGSIIIFDFIDSDRFSLSIFGYE